MAVETAGASVVLAPTRGRPMSGMRALTVRQPWASLLAWGEKQIETRDWTTPYRGWLAIHAAKGFDPDEQAYCFRPPFLEVLIQHSITMPADLPRGSIIAVANLHAIGRILQRSDGAVMVRTQELPVTEQEQAFGNFAPGRQGWRLTNVHPLREPIPVRGAQGLWDVPSEALQAIRAQLGEAVAA